MWYQVLLLLYRQKLMRVIDFGYSITDPLVILDLLGTITA